MHSRKDAAPRLGRTRNVILYLRDDVALNLRRGVSAQPHQHHAVQLTLALDAPFDAAVGAATGQYWGVLIDRDVPHRIAAHEHWTATFFINPETAIGEAVRRRLLHGTRCQTINQGMMRAIIDSLRGSLQEPLTCAQYEA